MKKIRTIAAVLAGALFLTGCGAVFDIGPEDLEKYADNNDGVYSELDPDSLDDYIEHAYLVETDDVILCYYEMHNTDNAREWYEGKEEELSSGSYKHFSSTSMTGGDCSITRLDGYYRILYYGNDVLYLTGDKPSVHDALESLEVRTGSAAGKESLDDIKNALQKLSDSLEDTETETETETNTEK